MRLELTGVPLLGLSCINEPSVIFYSIDSTNMDRASAELEKLLDPSLQDDELVRRCANQRVLRMKIYNENVKLTVSLVVEASHYFRFS